MDLLQVYSNSSQKEKHFTFNGGWRIIRFTVDVDWVKDLKVQQNVWV